MAIGDQDWFLSLTYPCDQAYLALFGFIDLHHEAPPSSRKALEKEEISSIARRGLLGILIISEYNLSASPRLLSRY